MLLLQKEVRPLVLGESHEELDALLVLKDTLSGELVAHMECHQCQDQNLLILVSDLHSLGLHQLRVGIVRVLRAGDAQLFKA